MIAVIFCLLIYLVCVTHIDYENVVQLLLQKGADVNYVRNGDGTTPLILSTLLDNGETVSRILIENGANVNATDNNGDSAFISAAVHGMNSSVNAHGK